MLFVNDKKKWILFGAGEEGQKLANLLKKNGQSVYAFADNNVHKIGSIINEINVISFEAMVKLKNECYIVVSVSSKIENILSNQLEMAGVKEYFKLQEVYDRIEYNSIHELTKYRNIYNGEECFIIGTGPSLKIEDLETLQENGVITFASNKIFKLYDETSWRPNYYFTTDFKVISQYYEEILNLKDSEVFVADFECSEECKKLDGERLNKVGFNRFVIRYKEKFEEKYKRNLPSFSYDVSCYTVDGGISVTYSMMQWAVYMGFKKIFLLGIDFYYADISGKSSSDHVGDNYMKEGELVNPPNLEKCEWAYIRAEKESRENGFRIYNATRGGKLEVFERVDFDTLFESKE